MVRRAYRPRSVDLPLAPLPVGRAELELLQLAGGGAGQLVPELDRGGALVAGEPLLAPRPQLLLGGGGAGREDDERLDGLTPLLVGDADHADLGDRGVREERVLGLDRRHVL